MSHNSLIITADREDYTVGLSGTVYLEGFSGRGKACFNNSDIKQFCSSLLKLSKTMKGKAELIGSQQKQDGTESLETFSLRLYIISASKLNGIIGIHCTLANDLQKLMVTTVNEITILGDLTAF